MKLSRNHVSKEVFILDFESIKRLRLDHYNIDVNKSYEIFDPSTNNHIIHLYLLKNEMLYFKECGL